MKEEKTIREWLEELPDGYRERALANMDPELGNINICKDLPEATSRAFVWENTPEEEGYKFWSDVYDWADGYGELPPLPQETGADWRSVKDELPDSDRDVLVSDGNRVSISSYNTKWIRRMYGDDIMAITHWMDLPELPEDSQ